MDDDDDDDDGRRTDDYDDGDDGEGMDVICFCSIYRYEYIYKYIYIYCFGGILIFVRYNKLFDQYLNIVTFVYILTRIRINRYICKDIYTQRYRYDMFFGILTFWRL